MNTYELIDAQLDWAVAKCAWQWEHGEPDVWRTSRGVEIHTPAPDHEVFSPSTNWAQGGPIIERERISINQCSSFNRCVEVASFWDACIGLDDYAIYMNGPTPLIAAMRCHVASELGDEVELPERLK